MKHLICPLSNLARNFSSVPKDLSSSLLQLMNTTLQSKVDPLICILIHMYVLVQEHNSQIHYPLFCDNLAFPTEVCPPECTSTIICFIKINQNTQNRSFMKFLQIYDYFCAIFYSKTFQNFTMLCFLLFISPFH